MILLGFEIPIFGHVENARKGRCVKIRKLSPMSGLSPKLLMLRNELRYAQATRYT